jgi:hypothetical protein
MPTMPVHISLNFGAPSCLQAVKVLGGSKHSATAAESELTRETGESVTQRVNALALDSKPLTAFAVTGT